MNFGSNKRKVKQDPPRRKREKKSFWKTRKPEYTTNSIKRRLQKAKFKIETSGVF